MFGGNYLSDLNLESIGTIQTDLLNFQNSICSKCGQKIRKPFRVPLSKNNISSLWNIYKSSKNDGYAKSKDMGFFLGASGSAEITRLKYLGAIEAFFSKEDLEKLSKRSGKWCLTERGKQFLFKQGTLPSYVVVDKEEIIEHGDEVFIDDESLKWQSEDDIWFDLFEFWESVRYKSIVKNDYGGNIHES